MRKVLAIILVLATLLFSGCSMPIENYNLVLMFGIDKDEKTGGYEVTLQMPKMGSEGEEEGTSIGNKTFTVFGVGKTLEQAVKDAYIKASGIPFLQHIQVVIIGEDVGKEGIAEMVDLFKRDPKYTLTPWLFTTKGKAEKILNAELEYDTLPSFSIVHTVTDVSKFNPKFYAIQFNKFLENIEVLPHGALMGRINLIKEDGKNILEISGASIYKDGKLIGMLDDLDIIGYNWLRDRYKSVDVSFPYKDMHVNIDINSGHTRVRPVIRGNKLIYRIDVKASGSIEHISSYPDLENDTSLLNELNTVTGRKIKSYINETVKRAQDQRIDYLGFEKVLEHTYPELWEQTKDDWDNIFPNIQVEIHTNISIKNTGWILDNPEIY